MCVGREKEGKKKNRPVQTAWKKRNDGYDGKNQQHDLRGTLTGNTGKVRKGITSATEDGKTVCVAQFGGKNKEAALPQSENRTITGATKVVGIVGGCIGHFIKRLEQQKKNVEDL